jgi:hypothetical protein
MRFALTLKTKIKDSHSKQREEGRPTHNNSKSEHCLSHRVGMLRLPHEEKHEQFDRLGFTISPTDEKTPYFSTFEGSAAAYFETPPKADDNENYGCDLNYDSETQEISFSNEKPEKSHTRRRKVPVILTSKILKY